MAIIPLHFVFINKYVAHFVAQSLLFPMVAITRFGKKCVTWALFPGTVTYICICIGYTIARSGLRAHSPRVSMYILGEAEGYMRTSGL